MATWHSQLGKIGFAGFHSHVLSMSTKLSCRRQARKTKHNELLQSCACANTSTPIQPAIRFSASAFLLASITLWPSSICIITEYRYSTSLSSTEFCTLLSCFCINLPTSLISPRCQSHHHPSCFAFGQSLLYSYSASPHQLSLTQTPKKNNVTRRGTVPICMQR